MLQNRKNTLLCCTSVTVIIIITAGLDLLVATEEDEDDITVPETDLIYLMLYSEQPQRLFKEHAPPKDLLEAPPTAVWRDAAGTHSSEGVLLFLKLKLVSSTYIKTCSVPHGESGETYVPTERIQGTIGVSQEVWKPRQLRLVRNRTEGPVEEP